MKKYFYTFIIALIIGFFLSYYFIIQYDDYNGIKVSSVSDELYFIQYGVFSSLESMESETISLTNYVYSKIDDKYYVYIGITNNSDNVNKIVSYYKDLGYETIIKKYQVNNKNFIESVKEFDNILLETTDKTVINSIINQTLIKYEQEVING